LKKITFLWSWRISSQLFWKKPIKRIL